MKFGVPYSMGYNNVLSWAHRQSNKHLSDITCFSNPFEMSNDQSVYNILYIAK